MAEGEERTGRMISILAVVAFDIYTVRIMRIMYTYTEAFGIFGFVLSSISKIDCAC